MRRALLAVAFAAGLVPLGAAAAPSEQGVEAPGPTGALKGTLLPAAGGGLSPVVLLIPGSGATDRNGDTQPVTKAAPLRLLAEALATRGVASVRVDKRGLFGSAGAGDPNDISLQEYARDAHAWVDAIRQQTKARCVWIAGHSEGGLIALEAARRPEGLCGIILLETAGRPLGQVLRDQLHASAPNATWLAQADAAIAKLERGEHVDPASVKPPLDAVMRPAVQRLLISEFAADPVALLKAYPGPALVVQGGTDFQVGVEDGKALAAARPGVDYHFEPGMNHVLKDAPADREGNIRAYLDPTLPLAHGLADRIAEFVKGH